VSVDVPEGTNCEQAVRLKYRGKELLKIYLHSTKRLFDDVSSVNAAFLNKHADKRCTSLEKFLSIITAYFPLHLLF
jgi:hypothetical protein